MELGKILEYVREKKPLVQCITNFVTVNDCANIILASGGSPTMAHDIREVEEAVAGVQALVCNMGAIEDADAMVLAGKDANRLGIPVILDPVAAGGTQLRRDVARRLLKEVHFAVIRGNASEIRSLAGEAVTGSGVDVGALDVITEENLDSAMKMIQEFARRTGIVIAVSGKLDLISNGTQNLVIRNGCETMARITGSGCMLTSLIGAFCGGISKDACEAVQGDAAAAESEKYFAATAAAMAAMGVCGEQAEARRLAHGTGNATFRTDLIDAVFNLTAKQLEQGARYEVFKG